MNIYVFPCGPFQTNAYLLVCTETRKAAIIDPGVDSAEVIVPFLEENKIIPEKIIITHSHWDHIANVARLKEKYHIPVLIHSLDAGNLQVPGSDTLPCWVEIIPAVPDQLLKSGDQVTVGNLAFTVIHTPGHSPGGICLYNVAENILISGDTLFKGSIGNLSFATSNAEKMWESLATLAALPPETKVYPGHGRRTTIGEETWLKNAKQIFGSY